MHGMSVEEALSAFRSAYARSVAWGCRSLRVIHGYGASGEGGPSRSGSVVFWKGTQTLFATPQGRVMGTPERVWSILTALPDVEGNLRGEILRYAFSPRAKGKSWVAFAATKTRRSADFYRNFKGKALENRF